jgi:predicted HD phosphohydrolase
MTSGDPIEFLIRLFMERSDAAYVGEPVSQTEHALRAAWAAEQADAGRAVIVAALLHDVGHLLYDLPEDGALSGFDDAHEVPGLPAPSLEHFRSHLEADCAARSR